MAEALRIADIEFLKSRNAIEFQMALSRYFKESGDVSATPEQSWSVIKDKLKRADLDILLILYFEKEEVRGFLYCRIMPEVDRDTARITAAYLPNDCRDRSVIDGALRIFENWAGRMGMTTLAFDTFRAPGAHRLMLKRGWKHRLTTYCKEL